MTQDELNDYIIEQIKPIVEAAVLAEREKQAEQEPVAWVNKERTQSVEWLKIAPEHGTKLYAAPVRTKDLTDDEIAKVAGFNTYRASAHEINVARAVIAADREKNK